MNDCLQWLLYNDSVRPIVSYGCEVWDVDVQHTQLKKFNMEFLGTIRRDYFHLQLKNSGKGWTSLQQPRRLRCCCAAALLKGTVS